MKQHKVNKNGTKQQNGWTGRGLSNLPAPTGSGERPGGPRARSVVPWLSGAA